MKKIKSKIYRNHRAEPYYTFLKNGLKTIEGRIRKGWYCDVKSGDHIIVSNNEETDSFEVRVKDVRIYKTIIEMLKTERLQSLLPDIDTVTEGVKVYKKYYTDKQEKEYGMVAIEVEKVGK